MYSNMLQCLTALPESLSKSEAPALDALLRLCAAYVPYYQRRDQVQQTLTSLPGLSTEGSAGETQLHDYIVAEIGLLLHAITSVKGLLRYLDGLEPLLMCSEEWKAHVGMVPLLRLQGELYSLTLPGGPRCAVVLAGVAAGAQIEICGRLCICIRIDGDRCIGVPYPIGMCSECGDLGTVLPIPSGSALHQALFVRIDASP